MSDKADKQLGRDVVFDKGRRDLAPAIRCGGEKMTLSALPLPFQVVSDSDILTGVTRLDLRARLAIKFRLLENFSSSSILETLSPLAVRR